MNLKVQKRLAAQVLKCSPKRITFDVERLDEIKESITKADIRSLINDKAIMLKPERGVSRARARKRESQKRKGRRKGLGKKKGKQTARFSKKERRIQSMRSQRGFLKKLRDKKVIDRKTHRGLYLKSKGGFFRSKRHIKLYIDEHNLAKK